MNSTGGSKIHHIKANPEPAFVPLTDEVRALPIQKGKWYMLASPEQVLPELYDSDLDSEELYKDIMSGATHIAILDKPKTLPKDLEPDMVWTQAQEIDRQAKDVPIGGTFEHQGKTFKVVKEVNHCLGCYFAGESKCPEHYCYGSTRSDATGVVFEKI